MTAQQLKASILQLAIQGKLVPQNPADEPASVLLKKIKAEKDALVKAGKIKKDKHESVIVRAEDGRYLEKKDGKTTDITDEIAFDIPETWEWVNLISIFAFIDYRGKTPTKMSSGIPLVTAKNVKNGYISYVPAEYISESEFSERKSRGVSRKGDILFTTEAPLGNVAIADIDTFSAGQRIITFQQYGKDNVFNNRLMMYYLLSPFFKSVLEKNHTGTTVAGIKAERLKQLIIPLPPLEEQKRIVAKIEELLPHVEEYGKAETELSKLNAELPEQLKKSILQWAIQGRLVPQDPTDEPAFELLKRIHAEKTLLIKSGKLKKENPLPPISEDEIPFDIPASWQWVRLGTISHDIQYGFTASASSVGNAKMLRITDIRDNSVSWKDVPFCSVTDEEFPKYQLHNRDILIARTGGTIGKTYIVNALSEKAVFASYLIRIIPALNLSEKYLKLFMESPLYWSELKSASAGTGQPNVNGQALRSLFLPVPPLAEQNRIVERLENLFVHLNYSLILDKGIITHGTE